MESKSKKPCKKVLEKYYSIFNTGKIDHKLKEIIRVQLSRTADCNY